MGWVTGEEVDGELDVGVAGAGGVSRDVHSDESISMTSVVERIERTSRRLQNDTRSTCFNIFFASLNF